MAKITKMCVGESLQGDGNEVAHIDLIIGPRGSAAESAFAETLCNQKEGVNGLLAVCAPNLMAKPATVMFNKVTIKGAKQAVQMFGPAQQAVANAVMDCVKDGTISVAQAEDLFIVLVCLYTGKPKMIKKYMIIIMKQQKKRLSALLRASQRQRLLFLSTKRLNIHLVLVEMKTTRVFFRSC